MKPLEPHDINRFPKQHGMLVFGISMSRISNAQDPEHCFEYMQHLVNKILKTDGVGLTFLYSDTLYMHSNEPAEQLRKKYLGAMLTHSSGFRKILSKHPTFIAKAFTYLTWSQMILDCQDFQRKFDIFKKLYAEMPALQVCVKADVSHNKKELTEFDIDFVLEESLAFYLIAKGKMTFPNEFIHGKEQWILNCYPGKPLFTEAFLMQHDTFKLHHEQNPYENHCYDLEDKKLHDLNQLVLPL